jgi:hypothetical protein
MCSHQFHVCRRDLTQESENLVDVKTKTLKTSCFVLIKDLYVDEVVAELKEAQAEPPTPEQQKTIDIETHYISTLQPRQLKQRWSQITGWWKV